MNVNGKRALLVAITLSTFFAAALTFGARNRWNARMVTITPTKSATETKAIVAQPDDKLIPCRTAVLSVPTHFEVESQWTSGGSSSVAVPYLKNGGTATLDCMKTTPRLITSYNDEIKRGVINVKCTNGALQVTSASCEGYTQAERDQIAAEAAAAAAAAEAARLAAIKAEEERQAAIAAEAARVAAEQAAAAAAAAAAAPCPSNCGGGTGSYTGGGGKNVEQWTVTYQQCNNGQKIVRSSGNRNSYAVGACYNSIP